ncbi:hypothetical protein FAZ95_34905 [Trinickia violacea]|uniref:Uncharacterized protein n=1 Tax=Trinickia violacea TaxID=2571746 RepID=A0A4P8IXP0_9BURK|nr:hypothetical protein [Trinickia violacea]QCP54168.1 hypothetical protein FAZ95_34905 [Trinickia violacea]
MHALAILVSYPDRVMPAFFATEGLIEAAASIGRRLRIEIHSALGVHNTLTREEIDASPAILVVADRAIDDARFNGKRIVTLSFGQAVQDARAVLAAANAEAPASLVNAA